MSGRPVPTVKQVLEDAEGLIELLEAVLKSIEAAKSDDRLLVEAAQAKLIFNLSNDVYALQQLPEKVLALPVPEAAE